MAGAYKGLALVVTGAIYLIIKAFNKWHVSIKEIDEKSKSLLNEYNSAIEKVNSNGKTIDDISEKYETLSKGVNELGQNVSLTTEEYEEYNSIANQIADMFPSLIKGYTDEGNAILSLKGNVNELRDAYKEAQQEAYNLLIVGGEDSDGNDIISNYQNQINGNESFLSTTSSYINGEGGAVDAINIISRLTGALTPEEFKETYDELYKEYKNIWNSDKIQNALKSSGFKELTNGDKWSEITTKDLENVKHSAKATIQTYKAEIDSQLNDVQTLANAYLMTNEDYVKLDKEAQNAASVIVNTINENIANGFKTKEDVGAYVSSLLESILEYPELQNDLIGLFTTDFSNMSIQDAAIAVNEYIDRITEVLEEDSTELKIRLGFDNYDELYEKYSNIIDFTNNKFADKDFDWDAWFEENSVNTQEELDRWLEIAKATNIATEAIKMYGEVVSDELSFREIAEGVKKLEKGFDQLDTIMADMIDGEDFDYGNFLDNEEFHETFGSLTNASEEYKDAYNEFIEEMSNSNGKLTSTSKAAFNKLATAYIEHETALDDVTEATKATTVAQLEQMGVANAKQIVEERIIANTEAQALQEQYLAQTGQVLLEQSWAQIQAYLDEAGACEVAEQIMAKLKLQQMDLANNRLDLSSDISQILSLAKAAGIAGAELGMMTEMQYAHDMYESTKSSYWADRYNSLSGELQNRINDAINAVEISFSPVNYKGGIQAQKAFKDATEDATDALEKEKKALEDLRNQYDELHDAIIWYYDQQIEKIDDKIEAIQDENEALEKQLENMDDILAAIENNYDAEIQLIQDKIDALQDENDEEERALALEEAKRKLQEAKSRKTLQVYEKGKGFVYTVDSKAIKEAEEELEDLQNDAIIEELEKQIEKLEEAKDKWSEIPEAYEKAMQEIAASKYFGSDWKNITLFPSDELLNSFQGNYTGIQGNIESNENEIDSLEQYKEKIEELKELWEDAKNAYQYAQYEAMLSSYFGSNYEYELLNNSKTWRQQYALEYGNVCMQIEAFENQIAQLSGEASAKIVADSAVSQEALAQTVSKLEETGKSADACKGQVGILDDTIQGMKDKTVKIYIDEIHRSSTDSYYGGTGVSYGYGAAGRAKGGIISKEDKGDFDFAARALGEDHMVALTEGEAVIPKDVVSAHPELVNALISSSGSVYRPISESSYGIDSKKIDYMINGLSIGNTNGTVMPSYGKPSQYIPEFGGNNGMTLSIGDIYLNGVQDPNGLARAIKDKLPRIMVQELNKR